MGEPAARKGKTKVKTNVNAGKSQPSAGACAPEKKNYSEILSMAGVLLGSSVVSTKVHLGV